MPSTAAKRVELGRFKKQIKCQLATYGQYQSGKQHAQLFRRHPGSDHGSDLGANDAADLCAMVEDDPDMLAELEARKNELVERVRAQ